LFKSLDMPGQWKSTKKKDETFLVVLNSYSQSKDILRLV